MEELSKLEEERRKEDALYAGPVSSHTGKKKERLFAPGKHGVPKGTASNEMCTFLIINISSLQLIPVNIIAYRAQYGSVNPAVIVGPGIAATAVSTIAAVLFCKMVDQKRRV